MRFGFPIVPKWVRFVAGLSLLSALVVVVGGQDIVRLAKQMDVRWVLAAAVCIVVATLIAAVNVHLFITRHSAIPFDRFLGGYWIAWAVGLIVPGQIGDIASLSIWLKSRGFAVDASVGVSLLDKLISLFWMLSLGTFGVLISGGYVTTVVHHWVVAVALLVVAGGGVLFACRGTDFVAWLKSRSGFLPRVASLVFDTISGATTRVWVNVLLSLVKLAVVSAAYWCVFRALGFDGLDLQTVVPLVAASSLVAYIPVSLNGIGTVELTALFLFGALGIPSAGVLSAYVLLRLLTFVLAWAPTLLLLTFSSPKTRHALN